MSKILKSFGYGLALAGGSFIAGSFFTLGKIVVDRNYEAAVEKSKEAAKRANEAFESLRKKKEPTVEPEPEVKE